MTQEFKRARIWSSPSIIFPTMSVYHNTHWHVFYKDLAFSPHVPMAVNCYMFDAFRWYATGTLSMRRPIKADGFQCISVKLCRMPMRRLFAHAKSMTSMCTLHSYASNCSNARRSRSVPPIIVSTLVPYTTTYLWSSLRSFPIPWPCSLSFHCKSSFYILFNTAYFARLLSHYLSVAL
jgi:hypothetical protein